MSLQGKAYIAGIYEHPLRRADNQSTAQLHAEVALGAELMATGPSTGIGRFQKEFHELVGYVAPSPAVLGNQIGDKIHPGINGEIGKTFALGGLVQARPYIEARAGLESLVRVGGDITIGHLGRDGLMLRDVIFTPGGAWRRLYSAPSSRRQTRSTVAGSWPSFASADVSRSRSIRPFRMASRTG